MDIAKSAQDKRMTQAEYLMNKKLIDDLRNKISKP